METHCPTCDRPLPDESRFCPACGEDLLGSVGSTLLQRPVKDGGPGAPYAGRLAPGASFDARFVPGTMFGERYRLVGLLGRGGMGEVYRADDLKLGEAVALKMLPPALCDDGELLERLCTEVRIARKISHANVCRVFDIGQVGDQHFLSMEYVDGENLASLLVRIGHPTPEKAVEVARQLCAGLAAAHDRQVLHRDLKPANVMIDGRGRVRITDFGLAGFEGDLAAVEMRSGTPAYMAPEQLAAGQVSVRSDLYTLGLILYETFTGRRPFTAKSSSDLARQQKEARRIPPSDVVLGIPPLTEQAILRCLAYEPADRPASADEVAASLPKKGSLVLVCRECHQPSPTGFLHCGRCGAPFAESSGGRAKAVSGVDGLASRPSVADHRQLTELFCDLAGATALAQELDAERLSELLQAYQKAAGEIVERFGGYVAQRLGDGLRAYFGYPRAHEDDARRAVSAGWEILEAVELLNRGVARDYGVRLGVRVSAHTETVVAGELVSGTRRDLVAAGPTIAVAALLVHRAAPGAMLVAESTYRLVRGFFVCDPLGPVSLKGVSRPVEVYRVRDESDWGGRFELAGAGELTRLVGRDLELALLGRCLNRLREARGQAVLITGEPGIGKSRLLLVIRELLGAEPADWLFCRCSPYYRKSAFHPVIRLLRRILEFRPEDSARKKLLRLERRLKQAGFGVTEALPLLASLLSLPLTERGRAADGRAADGRAADGRAAAPAERKDETSRLLLDMILRLAERRPVVLVVEDLHWIDPSSLALLELLMAHVPGSRLLVAMTTRPEFKAPWDASPHLTNINLDRLSQDDVRSMIEDLAGGKALPPEVESELLRKTDGIPLAVEELTRMVLASDLLVEGENRYELAEPFAPSVGGEPRINLAIPATLQDSLEARLDRLGAFREVAQLAATIGREFSYELLEAVSPLDAPVLREGLARLTEAELLLQRGLPPRATYIFKHALIQEAAYRSLMSGQRRRFHDRVAHVLAEGFPEVSSTQPELVAHHATEAGAGLLAAEYWLRAGRLAAERSANREAVDHLQKGLALVPSLPPGPERDRLERRLETAFEEARAVLEPSGR